MVNGVKCEMFFVNSEWQMVNGVRWRVSVITTSRGRPACLPKDKKCCDVRYFQGSPQLHR